MIRLCLTICFLAVSVAFAGSAQTAWGDVQITAQSLRGGVHVLYGRGGNIGVWEGQDGVVLIDDQFAPLTDKIVAAVAEISDRPIRFVLNTHFHGDHTGGNENLGKQGVEIIAHDNVFIRMANETKRGERIIPPSPKEALPILTFNDEFSIRLNDDEARAYHIANAHTDGDSLIKFTTANVVHMGDTYFNTGGYPFIDTGSGGSIDGAIMAAKTGLDISDDQTIIIPGHGPVSTRAELQKYHDRLIEFRTRLVALIDRGMTLDQIKQARPLADYDEKFGQGFVNPERFLTALYISLTAE